ncbi:E3 ubiquitin-protein ligase TRIM39-like [Narcine bancroftii]|uniref:E3 ubiquitin-protein ligase TRIM39-like n=1 Tax=Narcine bancroftii TaxID=1343680 RepID=UPI003831B0C8
MYRSSLQLSCSMKWPGHQHTRSKIPSIPQAPSGRVRYCRGSALLHSEWNLNQEVLRLNMASGDQIASWTKEVICPICLEFFTDPVVLQCGHNFCRSCITGCWEGEERNSCPECRAEFAEGTLRGNRAMANLAEKARKLDLNRAEKERKPHCGEHREELKLFCETDQKLICVVCAAAREHKSHNFMPIEEGVEIYKDRVKTSLESLTKKKSAIQQMERQQKRRMSRVREETCSRHTQIMSQFTEMHQLLTVKERHLLRNLREEEKRILKAMEKNLQEIEDDLHLIQQEMSMLQEQMDEKDSVMFLKEEARRKRRMRDDGHSLSVIDDALPIQKFDHSSLLNAVLKETYDAINQVSVTLDADTAHHELEVSDDQKRVRWTRSPRNLPVTGKRFKILPCALGSEGFTSGRHYWEVEVSGNRGWCLGVAAESVGRKGRVRLSPETGVWSIGRWDDGFYVYTSPPSRLPAAPIPGTVGVYLSYESGTVSFYSADTKSHLHTFTGNKFTGKLYPFFETWDENKWLRICSGPVLDLLMPRIPGTASGRVGEKPQ